MTCHLFALMKAAFEVIEKYQCYKVSCCLIKQEYLEYFDLSTILIIKKGKNKVCFLIVGFGPIQARSAGLPAQLCNPDLQLCQPSSAT